MGIRSLASLTAPNSAKAGISQKPENEYTGRSMVHLDAFCWVKRDSYLPQGTQGLKAVTRAKLGYEPGTIYCSINLYSTVYCSTFNSVEYTFVCLIYA